MRRRSTQREGLQTLSEINVTPMLDLCFVLLVIFMITTPLLENNNDLALPSGAASDHPVDADKVRTLTIDRNEAVALDGESVPLAGNARAAGNAAGAKRARTWPWSSGPIKI